MYKIYQILSSKYSSMRDVHMKLNQLLPLLYSQAWEGRSENGILGGGSAFTEAGGPL